MEYITPDIAERFLRIVNVLAVKHSEGEQSPRESNRVWSRWNGYVNIAAMR